MQVIVNKAGTDCVSDVISQCLSWSSTKYVPSNLSTCKEFLVLLGMTFPGNGRFTKHIKRKLFEAHKCLYVLMSLRKEEYNQVEIDHLFQ